VFDFCLGISRIDRASLDVSGTSAEGHGGIRTSPLNARTERRKDDPMRVQEMMSTHPSPTANSATIQCVEACLECFQTCTSCADACLAENDPGALVSCIRTDLDCADLCAATARVLSRQTTTSAEIASAQARALATACRACAAECEKHASVHEHCRICAEACRACAERCDAVAGAAI